MVSISWDPGVHPWVYPQVYPQAFRIYLERPKCYKARQVIKRAINSSESEKPDNASISLNTVVIHCVVAGVGSRKAATSECIQIEGRWSHRVSAGGNPLEPRRSHVPSLPEKPLAILSSAAEDQDGVQKHAGRASGCLRSGLAASKNSRRWKSEDQRGLKDEGHRRSLPKKSRGVLYAAHASHGPLASSSIEPDSQNLRSVAIESSQSTSKNTLRGRAPQDVQRAKFAAPRETASGF
ncbi:hypothetical protein C8R47DRAFT_1079089 [Mycena vitilis]|nr:hypothetical protein C8R47DRAFT_1079089 [Mycena vitilis]